MKWLLFSSSILLLLSSALLGQSIKGTIIDAESGLTLPNCNISIVGTFRGTTSNLDGVYKLKLPLGKHELLFQYIGYQSKYN